MCPVEGDRVIIRDLGTMLLPLLFGTILLPPIFRKVMFFASFGKSQDFVKSYKQSWFPESVVSGETEVPEHVPVSTDTLYRSRYADTLYLAPSVDTLYRNEGYYSHFLGPLVRVFWWGRR